MTPRTHDLTDSRGRTFQPGDTVTFRIGAYRGRGRAVDQTDDITHVRVTDTLYAAYTDTVIS